MSTYQVQFAITPDKKTAATRVTRGTSITNQAKTSALYQVPEVKMGVDSVIQDTATLKVMMDNYTNAQAALLKAKTALGAAIIKWDGSYDLLITAGLRNCTDDNDGAGLALPVQGRTKNPFAMPIGVDATFNPKLDYLRIYVQRAPGMDTVAVEVSQEPVTPTSWKELDGNGAIHIIPHPAPGTLWVRAATRTSRAKSDFTTPVSVIVK